MLSFDEFAGWYEIALQEAEHWEEIDNEIALHEVKRIVRIDYTGKRKIRFKCAPGFIWNGKQCVALTGGQIQAKRKAARRAALTKRMKGKGYQTKINRKRMKAVRRRRLMGNATFKNAAG